MINYSKKISSVYTPGHLNEVAQLHAMGMRATFAYRIAYWPDTLMPENMADVNYDELSAQVTLERRILSDTNCKKFPFGEAMVMLKRFSEQRADYWFPRMCVKLANAHDMRFSLMKNTAETLDATSEVPSSAVTSALAKRQAESQMAKYLLDYAIMRFVDGVLLDFVPPKFINLLDPKGEPILPVNGDSLYSWPFLGQRRMEWPSGKQADRSAQ